MTPRERVLAVLNGERPDKVPFTVYESKFPQCAVERELRNRGLCIVNRRVGVYATRVPGCTVESHHYSENGRPRIRTIQRTPVGDLEEIREPAGYTSWTLKKLFTKPEDYGPLQWLVEHTEISPAYDEYRRAEDWMGDDVILRAAVGATPLHQIMIAWMGVETFAVEWADRRDEILRLERALRESRRKVYPILARSPVTHANYGGNEVPEVMGPPRFREFCVPVYEECARHFHAHGKLLGTHLDGNNAPWADIVAAAPLDYIEAFSPAPDSDMTLEQALNAWPNKVVWINVPSSLHVAGIEAVREAARDYVRLAKESNRVIVGITEDIPPDLWQAGMLAVADAIEEG